MGEPETTTPASRPDGREPHQMRSVRFHNHIAPHAAGSTLVEWGNTRVICGVTIEDGVPRWMKEQDVTGGWITAEYSMLPYSTLQRKPRDSTRGKIDGRSQEIHGSLAAPCARPSTSTNSAITRSGWTATCCRPTAARAQRRSPALTSRFYIAVRRLIAEGRLTDNPILHAVAAVSVGIVNGQPLLDLCYAEDVAAQVDFNLVMNSAGEFIEIQGGGEQATFADQQLADLLALGKTGINELLVAQSEAITQA